MSLIATCAQTIFECPPIGEKTHAHILLPEDVNYHFAHKHITDKMKINVGSITLQALATPGHTMDTMTF